MATFSTDFSGDAIGSFPSGFYHSGRSTASDAFNVQSVDGENALTAPTFNILDVCYFNEQHSGILETLYRVYQPGEAGKYHLRVHGDEGANRNNAIGYSANDASTTKVNASKIEAKFTSSTFATAPISGSAISGWFYLLIRVEPGSPNVIKIKMWNDGDSEPSSWDINTTDSSITSYSGKAGLFSTEADNSAAPTVGYAAIGTAGDSAPREQTSSTTTYTLSGTVTDDGGSAIDGATVIWEMNDGTQLDSGTTDANGNYSLSAEISDGDLPNDTNVTAQSSGHVDQTKQQTVDTASTSYTVDFSLTVSLSPASMAHGHTMGATTAGVDYPLAPGAMQHGHGIGASSVNVNYGLSPAAMQHGHTMGAPGLTAGHLLTPEDLGHGHTMEEAGLSVAYVLSTSDMQHGHTMEEGIVGVNYDLTTESLLHGHTLAETGVSVLYALSPDDLAHGHTLADSGLSVAYLLSPADMQHGHTMGNPVLVVKGNATQVHLDARPRYRINLDASPTIDS